MGQARLHILPPPTGGTNEIDSLSQMPETDAIELINMYPDIGKMQTRDGTTLHVTLSESGTYGTQCGLHALPLANGDARFVATSNKSYWEADASATLTKKSDFTWTLSGNDAWQGCVFMGGLHLAANGEDPKKIVGAAAGTVTMTEPAWTGPTLTALCNVASYKSRLYFVETDSLSVWYGDVEAVAGALTEFDFARVFSRGGYLQFVGSTSVNNNAQYQALFVAVSSEGEILVYQGDYPGSSTWSLVGQYFVPPVPGRRAFFHVGADLNIITKGGVVAMSDILQGNTREGQYVMRTDKINGAIQRSAYTWTYKYITGCYWPEGQKVFILAPYVTRDGTTINGAWVQNLATKAWCYERYDTSGAYSEGRPTAIAVYDGNVYTAHYDSALANIRVCWLSSGNTADDATSGADKDIPWEIRHAFSYMGRLGQIKNANLVKPLITATNQFEVDLAWDTDFEIDTIDDNASATTFSAGFNRQQRQASGTGVALALKLSGSTSTRVQYHGSIVTIEDGGIL